MTGWGQDGPWARSAGHDLNYVAMTGALHAIGPADGPPSIPLNLLGDYGGGATYLVMGLLAGLWQAGRSGRGQVVDAAIVDGVAHLMAGVHGFVNAGLWTDRRGANLLDGAAPFYRLYVTSDGRHVAVGGIEPPFFQEMCRLLEVDLTPEQQHDPAAWPHVERTLAQVFATRPMDHWARLFDGTDACVTPVPSVAEAEDAAHLRARGTLGRDADGRLGPAPAPRFSRTPTTTPTRPVPPGSDTRDVLDELGLDADALIAAGVAHQIDPRGDLP
ncbi:MAG: CaiB/BaiF CoA-transferase family protein [Aeromicrobium erythreum]